MSIPRIQRENAEQLVYGWLHDILPKCSFSQSEDGPLEIRSLAGYIRLSVTTHVITAWRVRVTLVFSSPLALVLSVETQPDSTLFDSLQSSIDFFTHDQIGFGASLN